MIIEMIFTNTLIALLQCIHMHKSDKQNPLFAAFDRSRIICDRPTTRPGVLVGELPKESNDLEGTFYVRDNKTFYIQLFSYDTLGPSE